VPPEILAMDGHMQGGFVELESCRRCLEWTHSPKKVLEVLTNQDSACAGCAQQTVIRTVNEQFQTRQPHWWVVDDVVVVPIWIVELLKSHREF
jgi:hypothetical protein